MDGVGVGPSVLQCTAVHALPRSAARLVSVQLACIAAARVGPEAGQVSAGFLLHSSPCSKCAIKWKDSIEQQGGGRLYIGNCGARWQAEPALI